MDNYNSYSDAERTHLIHVIAEKCDKTWTEQWYYVSQVL